MAVDVALIFLMDIGVNATQDIKRASPKCVKASHRFTLYLYYLKMLFCDTCIINRLSLVEDSVLFLTYLCTRLLYILSLFVLGTLSDTLSLQISMNALN